MKLPHRDLFPYIGEWAHANNVEIAHTSANSSWLNRIPRIRPVERCGTFRRAKSSASACRSAGTKLAELIVWARRRPALAGLGISVSLRARSGGDGLSDVDQPAWTNRPTIGQEFARVVEDDDAVAQQAPPLLGVEGDGVGRVTVRTVS